MNPDTILAGLRAELQRAPERADEINKEIARVDALPRPVAKAEDPATATESILDRGRLYLRALEKELERAEKSRAKEIKDEITRVKDKLARKDEPQVERAISPPDAEQAVNEPGGEPAAEPTPDAPAAA